VYSRFIGGREDMRFRKRSRKEFTLLIRYLRFLSFFPKLPAHWLHTGSVFQNVPWKPPPKDRADVPHLNGGAWQSPRFSNGTTAKTTFIRLHFHNNHHIPGGSTVRTKISCAMMGRRRKNPHFRVQRVFWAAVRLPRCPFWILT